MSAHLRRQSEPLSADFADQATQRENDAVLDAIGHSAESELQQLDRAPHRLAEGCHAICEVCGGPIELERLAAVLYADRCSYCAPRT